MTYWQRGPNNGTGGHSYAPGAVTPCRYADKLERVTTSEGNIVDSTRVYYFSGSLKPGDMVALGDYNGSPTIPTEASEVVKAAHTPSASSLSKVMI
jgi:hypothetical protein